jgi:hypothetical protein
VPELEPIRSATSFGARPASLAWAARSFISTVNLRPELLRRETDIVGEFDAECFLFLFQKNIFFLLFLRILQGKEEKTCKPISTQIYGHTFLDATFARRYMNHKKRLFPSHRERPFSFTLILH